MLGPFKGDDAILASQVIDRAADAVETWLIEGIDLAMTRHNGNISEPKPTPKKAATEGKQVELAPDFEQLKNHLDVERAAEVVALQTIQTTGGARLFVEQA